MQAVRPYLTMISFCGAHRVIGTFDVRTSNDANDRMRAAGVHVLSSFAMACELMRDWRATPGAVELMPFFDKYLPEYGFLARSHDSALKDGTPSGLPTKL